MTWQSSTNTGRLREPGNSGLAVSAFIPAAAPMAKLVLAKSVWLPVVHTDCHVVVLLVMTMVMFWRV
ncbi:MAG: hypothetical protein IH867_10460 [Chloroflexi bacterium]|nr:hypothetical protein [Chloroflexota bacterium]